MVGKHVEIKSTMVQKIPNLPGGFQLQGRGAQVRAVTSGQVITIKFSLTL